MKKFYVFLFLFVLLGLQHNANAQVSMSPENWKVSDPNAKFENYMGQQSLFLQSGTALVKNSKLEDGVIEVDLHSPTNRVFGGIVFRAQAFEELEYVYIRLHKNSLPDAIQYTPRFRGVDPWQLYNVGYTAEAGFKRDAWTHLKIEIEGRTIKIYVNNATKPNLVVEDMKRHEGKGEVGLCALNGAYFSNFTYTSRPLSAEPVKKKNEFQKGTITQWDISQVFSTANTNLENYPAKEQSDAMQWEQLDAEMPGFINFSRYRNKGKLDSDPLKSSEDVIFARKKIVSTKEQIKKLLFGYSDRVAIYLNGKILFYGNSAFRARDAQFLGAIGLNDAVYLNLKKGENELLFVVADKTGGWGMWTQFADTEGLNFN